MKLFDTHYLSDLTVQAKNSFRLRQHSNVHQNYDDPCQRLFNAIEPGSYIRPHRHMLESREELLIAICGSMALICFNDQGDVIRILHLGSEKYGSKFSAGVEIEPHVWHTVLPFEPGCILFEVKSGPFNPKKAKEMAPWAPEEGTESAKIYYEKLRLMI